MIAWNREEIWYLLSVGKQPTNHKNMKDKLIKGKEWKLIAKAQKVGDGSGYGYVRDLYQDCNGARVSIKVSSGTWRS